jgi:carboxyl-terminal processing protease
MTNHSLTRFARRVALFFFVAAAALLVASLFGKPPQLASSAQAATADSHSKGSKDNFDLSQLETLRKVIVFIKDNYVDPKRVDPREMFVSALEAVEKSTAEVMVEGSAKDGTVKVTCGNASKDFRVDDIDSIWKIPLRMKPVFAFIQDNLVTSDNKRDIEYSAINGMLSTLDPHSWLLKPDVYKEMKITTKGEFGGLGFVIAMDEERLVVKKVLKNTPASKNGIKKGDHIARIEDESTVNMDLNEAVSKLRGKPGTGVRILVKRDKEEEKVYSLTRDVISVESVTSQMLADNVGYARISQFGGTTARDLASAVRDLKSQSGGKLKGLVLDLRSNPGGLLDMAIQVADQFLEKGVIVTTAGYGDRVREEKEAHNDGNDREYPIVVLVNSESASASEIVSGALKNLNRAVIVGRQTFGKGSVQVLYDLPESGTKDEAALKLTIAQYLTPGNQSIQEIGVTPDIELIPALITKDRVDLFSPPRLLREADLDKHFNNGFAPAIEAKKVVEAAEKPAYSLRYLKEEKASKKDKDHKDDDSDEPPPEEPDEDLVAADFQVQFARELILRAPKTDRQAMLGAASGFLQDRRTQEEAKIEKAVTALGIDWSSDSKRVSTASTSPANVEFKVNPVKPSGGEFMTMTLTVQNNGKVPFEKLRAYTRCDAEKTSYDRFCRLLERREFLLGKVNPGEKKSWSTTLKVPNYLPASRETLALVFQEAHNNAPPEQTVEVEAVETPRPAFGFTYQVLDKDGLAEPGESVDVQVDVKNTGVGKTSKNTYVSLKSQGSDKIFMKKGRQTLGQLQPGETKSVTLTLEVRPGFDASQGVPMKIEIGDRDLWEFTAGKVTLPAVATPPALSNASGTVRVEKDGYVTAAPLANAPILAETRKGALLPVLGKTGEFYKVEWQKGADGQRSRVGFISANAVVLDGSAKIAPGRISDPKVTSTMDREPPAIALLGVEPSKAAVVTDDDRFKLTGSALDTSGLQDVRIFVDNEKVFFRTSKGADSEPGRNGKASKINFAADFPLKPGNNMVLVVARENEEFSSQRTLIINRRTPAVPIAQRKATEPTK